MAKADGGGIEDLHSKSEIELVAKQQVRMVDNIELCAIRSCFSIFRSRREKGNWDVWGMFE